MSELAAPVRETKTTQRQCRCVLTYTRDKADVRCGGPANGPDSPFCAGCENRHPEKDPKHVSVTVFTGADE